MIRTWYPHQWARFYLLLTKKRCQLNNKTGRVDHQRSFNPWSGSQSNNLLKRLGLTQLVSTSRYESSRERILKNSYFKTQAILPWVDSYWVQTHYLTVIRECLKFGYYLSQFGFAFAVCKIITSLSRIKRITNLY